MKQLKNTLFLISLLCLAITGGINVFGYLRLPETIATQISFTGGSVNTMPKAYYLIGAFLMILVFTALVKISEGDKRIKWFLVNVLITVANGIMVFIQV